MTYISTLQIGIIHVRGVRNDTRLFKGIDSADRVQYIRIRTSQVPEMTQQKHPFYGTLRHTKSTSKLNKNIDKTHTHTHLLVILLTSELV